MEKKFDCYKCKFRGTLAGSAHSCCEHPEATKKADGMAGLASVMSGGSPIIGDPEKLNIKGHPQGIRGGWFRWPSNFDPRWLANCDGFKAEEEKKNENNKQA